MGPIVKLLQAIRNLTKGNAIKTLDQALDLAKRELGPLGDRLKKQIGDAFNQGKREQKSADIIQFPEKREGIESISKGRVKDQGEVIEAVFKPGKDKRGKVVEESPSQKKGDIFEDVLEAAKEMQKQKNLESSPLMKRLEEGIETIRTPENLTLGLTRTIAREILMKRGIDLGKGMDPIEIFRSKFGEEILGDVANLADELIEMEAMGKTPRRLEDILEQEGMFDIKMPKEPPRGYTNEELAEIQKEIDREDILLKFDPKDREPNAKGGRVGYEDGGLGSLPRGLRMDTTTFNPIPEDAPKMAADEIAKVIMGTLGNDEDMTSRTFIFEEYVMPKRKDLMENYGLTLEEADNLIRQEMEKYRTKKAGGGLSYLSGF
tara:strand:- start:2617 stop:3744 length:1128 start_codon:yes stop_codon:yes gene_type:complete